HSFASDRVVSHTMTRPWRWAGIGYLSPSCPIPLPSPAQITSAVSTEEHHLAAHGIECHSGVYTWGRPLALGRSQTPFAPVPSPCISEITYSLSSSTKHDYLLSDRIIGHYMTISRCRRNDSNCAIYAGGAAIVWRNALSN